MKKTYFFLYYRYEKIAFLLIFIFLSSISRANELNIYSARSEALIKPLLDIFEKENGIKVNLITGDSDILIKRLESESQNSPADIFLTIDAGALYRVKKLNLFQEIDFSFINKKNKISKDYYDKEKKWISLSKRIRTVVYAKNLNPENLLKFEDLANVEWKGKICVRSSNNIYNQSLVASLISNHGEEKAEVIIKNIVKNFAKKPSGNDRAQITSVANNECNIAIINHYYYAQMLNSKEPQEREAAKKVNITFLNQKDRGAHVNISGLGIVKYSKNKKNAYKLISFLLREDSQVWYANINYEYPVIDGLNINSLLGSWGKISLDEGSINNLGNLNYKAVRLMDRVGWQ